MNNLNHQDFDLDIEEERMSDEEAQDSINNWVEKYPELQTVVDKYKSVSSPVGILKEINAQDSINNWLKNHPELQTVVDKYKDSTPKMILEEVIKAAANLPKETVNELKKKL